MRVIFVTDLGLWSMGKGFGGPAFSKTITKYIESGDEVFLLSDVPENRNYSELDEAHNIILEPTRHKRNIMLRKIGLLFRWLDHRKMTRMFCDALRKLIEENGTDDTVLYAYEIFGVEACRRVSKEYGIPFVTRFQGTILTDIKPGFFSRIRFYPHCQAIGQNSDLIIMTDDGTCGKRVAEDLGNTSRMLFLRNGLDLMNKDIGAMKIGFKRSEFRETLLGDADESASIFLTVSRLVSWKKVDRAIKGFADFKRMGGNGKLVIVGDGNSRDVLEEYAEELGVSQDVVFTGAVAHDSVYGYMMACDVFLSLYDLSNVGNPLLEAMTLGTAIVTLDVGDTRMLIHDRENGILLTYDSLDKLGEVMSELAGNNVLRDSLGKLANDYAMKNFQTWEKRMESEYRAVLEIANRNKEK